MPTLHLGLSDATTQLSVLHVETKGNIKAIPEFAGGVRGKSQEEDGGCDD